MFQQLNWTQVISTYKGPLHIINNNNNTYVSNSRIQYTTVLSHEHNTYLGNSRIQYTTFLSHEHNTYLSNSRIQYTTVLSHENFMYFPNNSIFDFNYSLFFSRSIPLKGVSLGNPNIFP